MRFAVVVVTWNGRQWITECLRSIASQEVFPHLVIIDNGSADGTAEVAEDFRASLEKSEVKIEIVRLETNTGFTAGVNLGLEIVRREFAPITGVLLLNQDAVLESGCLEAFKGAMSRHQRTGAFGPKILYPADGQLQHAGGFLEKPRMVGLHYGHHENEKEGKYDEEREVEFVTGAAMMLRMDAVDQVGVFNEVFSPGYYEDVDLCDRLRTAGWSVLYVPSARVVHHESASFSDRDARLRLAHRNRFIYALGSFEDEFFCTDFLSAEMEFLGNQATFDEVRAVSGGTLDVLARLSAYSRLRTGHENPPEPIVRSARQILLEVRQACNLALRGR